MLVSTAGKFNIPCCITEYEYLSLISRTYVKINNTLLVPFSSLCDVIPLKRVSLPKASCLPPSQQFRIGAQCGLSFKLLSRITFICEHQLIFTKSNASIFIDSSLSLELFLDVFPGIDNSAIYRLITLGFFERRNI